MSTSEVEQVEEVDEDVQSEENDDDVVISPSQNAVSIEEGKELGSKVRQLVNSVRLTWEEEVGRLELKNLHVESRLKRSEDHVATLEQVVRVFFLCSLSSSHDSCLYVSHTHAHTCSRFFIERNPRVRMAT